MDVYQNPSLLLMQQHSLTTENAFRKIHEQNGRQKAQALAPLKLGSQIAVISFSHFYLQLDDWRVRIRNSLKPRHIRILHKK